MADLITVDRAKQELGDPDTTPSEDAALAAFIAAVSSAIERYCRRDFALADYDETCHGNGTPVLRLRRYPLVAVASVAGNPVPVLRVRNDDPDVRRAAVAVTDTGLTLTRTAGGTTAADTSVTWAENPTLADVAGAVNALGDGWSAGLVGDAGGWSSADLASPCGALSARGRPAELVLHVEERGDFDIDAEAGLLRLDRTGGVWARGVNNYRVRYSAGYATVPADVQQACAAWVARLFWQARTTPGVSPAHPPAGTRRLLESWRTFAA